MLVEEIKKLNDGDGADGIFAVLDPIVKTAKNGSSYLDCKLVDRTGVVKAKMWDWSGEPPCPQTVWSIVGKNSPFMGQSQLIISRKKDVAVDEHIKQILMPSLSNDEIERYKKRATGLIGQIINKNLRDFVIGTLTKVYPEYWIAPGAAMNHHAYLGGLLQHSVCVTEMALAMGERYKQTCPEKYDMIDFDLLIASGLLHDLGKIGEYRWDITIEHSFEGTLTRHYDTGPMYLMNAVHQVNIPIHADIILFITHVMVTHHGIELSEKPPSSITAWLIQAADLADSFIDVISGTLASGSDKEGLSLERNWVLKNKCFDERAVQKWKETSTDAQ